MTKIKLDKLNETVEEISAEPMLITNAINQNNAKTHGLHKTLINKIKDGNSKQYRLSENLKETILYQTLKMVSVSSLFHFQPS